MGIFGKRKHTDPAPKISDAPEISDAPAHGETQENALSILKHTSFSPKIIVDVGANKGQWTRGCRKFYPDASYYLFEPQAGLLDDMQDLARDEKIQINSVGLGREKGVSTFTLHDRDDSCSFAFTNEEAETRNFKQVELEIDTLDGFVQENGLSAPDILKIDAEGWDLEVLAGSEGSLPKVDVVFVEACVCKTRTPNDLLTVMKYMDERGFSLVDFSDLNRPHQLKLLWLVEAMFVRRASQTYEDITSYKPG